ncbi:MAG: porin family protein [Carboxylicivirga sp.]|nr:porin family protein [Carboxylicivirga sp.]
MMRRVVLFLFIVSIYQVASAQFRNKDWYITPKISFADYSNRNDWNGYSINKIPPISVSVEKGVTDFLSIGALAGFNSDKYENDTLSTNVHKYSDFAVGAIANVHFAGWIEKWSNYSIYLGDWDIYAGLGTLFKWSSTDETDVWNKELKELQDFSESSFNVKIRPLVGVRYFLNDNITMLVEVGHGNLGLFTTGLTFRIPHAY